MKRVVLHLEYVQSISYNPETNETIIQFKLTIDAALYNEIRIPPSYILTFGDMEDEGLLFIDI